MVLLLIGDVRAHRIDCEKPMENAPYPLCHANSASAGDLLLIQIDELRFNSFTTSAVV